MPVLALVFSFFSRLARESVKNDLIILNFIAANKWKRPIYFTSPMGELGFGAFLRKDGLSYRLVPAIPHFTQMNWIADQSLPAYSEILAVKIAAKPELPKVEAAPAATAKPAPAKRITITCIKGKTTQKVTGTAPKCPSGFKKK